MSGVDQIEKWHRASRSNYALGSEPGVYALFLREPAALPTICPGVSGLLYIGLAANRRGLAGRCHFNAKTRNHSPRKSLAVLLMEDLGLVPILIAKPNSPATWGLDEASEVRLSEWMHRNLDLAIELNANPEPRETELISRYVPPLNLSKCLQTAQHKAISAGRAAILSRCVQAQR